jgi:ribosomal-protein-alanine N-acetyltransferase
VLGIDTLLAVADDARHALNQRGQLGTGPCVITALLDARMDELYAATYQFDDPCQPNRPINGRALVEQARSAGRPAAVGGPDRLAGWQCIRCLWHPFARVVSKCLQAPHELAHCSCLAATGTAHAGSRAGDNGGGGPARVRARPSRQNHAGTCSRAGGSAQPPRSNTPMTLVPTPCAERALFIEPMTEADVACVAATEQRACAHPWTLGNFRDSLAAGYPACLLTTPLLPGDNPPQITASGRMLLGYWVAMNGVDEVHLLNITVAPEHRRQGWARAMMHAMSAAAVASGAHWLWLEVRVGNTPAKTLYQQVGFLPMGVRKQYYPAEDGQREDAIVMSLNLRAAGAMTHGASS